jgi:hypothetical protein
MSIAFRLKYALGLIPSADKLDAKWDSLKKMRDDLNQMESSEELKQFEDLKNLIDSSSFRQHKHEVESLRYSGSKEENLILEYRALSRSNGIRNYKKISTSTQLDRLQKILKGSTLTRFLDLQKAVDSKEFRKRKAGQKKKVFVRTPDFELLKEYNQLRKNDEIRFWKKFSHSDSYLSYLSTDGSNELKRLEELSVLTTTDVFNKKVAYLKDKKRFLKSEEYKKIIAFKELDKSKFMADYRKLKMARQLEFFEKWNIIFDESFNEKVFNNQKWEPENWLGVRAAGVSFSQEGEMQSFNGEKNIQMINNTLSLWARKEKVTGKVWNPAVGLMPKSYEYTSCILNSAEYFRFKEGVLETKVRFKKDATIISAFALTGEKPFPQIDLFRSTKSGIGLGIIEKKGGKATKYKRLNGLNDGNFHIFRLELFNSQFVWKINGVEVYRNSTYLEEPLFFNLLTTLHGKVNEHLLPHRFEVDWIRCFSPKS